MRLCVCVCVLIICLALYGGSLTLAGIQSLFPGLSYSTSILCLCAYTGLGDHIDVGALIACMVHPHALKLVNCCCIGNDIRWWRSHIYAASLIKLFPRSTFIPSCKWVMMPTCLCTLVPELLVNVCVCVCVCVCVFGEW